MIGSKLAGRIVLPLLALVGVLFAILAAVAVRVADSRVEEELNSSADRIARALDQIPAGALPQLAELMGVEIAVRTNQTWVNSAGWSGGFGKLKTDRPEVNGVPYRAVKRDGRADAEYIIFTPQEQLTRRRRDALVPVLTTGALGLFVAAVLGILVARTIARPVRALSETAGRYARGEETGPLPAHGPGEIGDLEDSFRKMLAAISESEEKLRESERFAALGRLAGGIAHELRNPLTAIRMAVETGFAGGATPPEEARDMALSEIDRLDRTLTELLEFVRPRKPIPQTIDLARFLDECAALLRAQCEHLGVSLDVDASGTVSADPDRLKQAILNLVLNGAQAQPRGGAVRLIGRDDEVSVADEGGGIDAEVRDELFQPFVSTKSAGIGLGLAVVKKVADEHGAELDFETGENGTTFRLKFPPAGA
ncbi:MAG: ATP-binding protein [Planctomycetota bacterium]